TVAPESAQFPMAVYPEHAISGRCGRGERTVPGGHGERGSGQLDRAGWRGRPQVHTTYRDGFGPQVTREASWAPNGIGAGDSRLLDAKLVPGSRVQFTWEGARVACLPGRPIRRPTTT